MDDLTIARRSPRMQLISPQAKPPPPSVSEVPIPPQARAATAVPFRLLDLPTELQTLVLSHIIDPQYPALYNVTLDYERLTMLRSRFHVLGYPNTSILLTSRHINSLASPLLIRLFSGRLILNSVFILVPLRRQERFAWLREHVHVLHFSDSSVHPERWARYFEAFENLRSVEIEFGGVKLLKRPKSPPREMPNAELEDSEHGTPFMPPLLPPPPESRPVRLCNVLAGREDELLLGCLDRLQVSLVEQLSCGRSKGGLEVVVRQRFRLEDETERWESGDGLRECTVVVNIRLSGDGAEILECVHEQREQQDGRPLRKYLEP